jgi:hypothetical protein
VGNNQLENTWGETSFTKEANLILWTAPNMKYGVCMKKISKIFLRKLKKCKTKPLSNYISLHGKTHYFKGANNPKRNV